LEQNSDYAIIPTFVCLTFLCIRCFSLSFSFAVYSMPKRKLACHHITLGFSFGMFVALKKELICISVMILLVCTTYKPWHQLSASWLMHSKAFNETIF